MITLDHRQELFMVGFVEAGIVEALKEIDSTRNVL